MADRRRLPDGSQTSSNGAPDASSSNMANNPWGSEPSDGGWEEVDRPGQNTRGMLLGPDGLRRPGDSTPVRPGIAHTRLEAEENAWDDLSKDASVTSSGEAPGCMKSGLKRTETNPFLRNKVSQPTEGPPTESLSRLGLNERSNNPWQPAIDAQRTGSTNTSNVPTPPPLPQPQPQPNLLDDDVRDPWAETVPVLKQPALAPSPILVSLPSRGDSPAWDEEPLGKNMKVAGPPTDAISDELTEDRNVWDDLGSLDKGKAKATGPSEQTSAAPDWNLIDYEPGSSAPKEPAGESAGGKPALPPRRSSEQAPWKPTREPVDGKSETYVIKNTTWYDASLSQERTSPILIQNVNGPCPLLALVNALTLTTPIDAPDTTLVQVLRSREQISLDLLLQAVLDELMSPRRTNAEDQLPDVTDLYSFLQSLHTGMNVNPRFIPTEKMVNAYKRTSLTHLHPTERGDLIPGTFENTAEMSLYAAFSIPLIHGWLPSQAEPAYDALERQAVSYEDAQNLLFREEELEAKLSDPEQGLTEPEQQLYQDVLTIRSFLDTSATQLTHWGIEVIGKAIRPGTFAILFRNDHFSTLYCHPQTMQLLILVTDAGFKTHTDIVWETLSDINGERTEFLSGKFAVIGSPVVLATVQTGPSQDDGGEWTTVQNRRGKAKQTEEAPLSPTTEQEDRDLALALQLQEEEDERHREAEARRRRESVLSEQYIERQARPPGPTNRGGREGGYVSTRGGRGGQQSGITTRGGGDGFAGRRTSSSNVNTTPAPNPQNNPQRRPPQQVVRPLVPPVSRPGVNRPADEGNEDAPPSYEQAAQSAAYEPPVGHPSHSTSSPTVSRQTTRTSMRDTPPQQPPTGMRQPGQFAGRRPPVKPAAVLGNGGSQGKDRDCVVM